MKAARIRSHILKKLGLIRTIKKSRIQISAKKATNLVGGNQVLKNPLGRLQEGVR
jgi:hypothetical protein